jgi:hypothetical protein
VIDRGVDDSRSVASLSMPSSRDARIGRLFWGADDQQAQRPRLAA